METNKDQNILILFISEDQSGQRIDKALGSFSEIGSRSRAEQLITEGRVTVNSKPIKSSYKVKNGDEIQVNLPLPKSSGIVAYDFPIEIVFEDNDILVINKPAGLVVHPSAGHEEDTLVNALIDKISNFSMGFQENRPGVVHRLDKDTSGLLVLAKNDRAQENLVNQFKDRSVSRIYYAIVEGSPNFTEKTIESFLARHPVDRKKFASVKSATGIILREKTLVPEIGKWASTNVKVIARQGATKALCCLKLNTGRTHQIRVHLSEVGLPILADPIYGRKSTNKNELLRLCLHAKKLSFMHPTTKELLSFEVPWPDDIAKEYLKFGEFK